MDNLNKRNDFPTVLETGRHKHSLWRHKHSVHDSAYKAVSRYLAYMGNSVNFCEPLSVLTRRITLDPSDFNPKILYVSLVAGLNQDVSRAGVR